MFGTICRSALTGITFLVLELDALLLGYIVVGLHTTGLRPLLIA